MSIVKRNAPSGVFQYEPADRGSVKADDAPKVGDVKFNNAGGIKERIEEMTSDGSRGYSSDDMKYAVAVKQAQDRMAGFEDVDDDRMKQEIDSAFAELEPSVDGRTMRGENTFTDAVGGIKSFLDDVTVGAGNGMDWVFDNTIGNLAGLVGGENLGNTFKDAFDGQDLSVIPDIAADIGLAMIPGAGIPLVAAKNAIQQADNFADALSGRDSVTLENLDGGERLGRGLEALGSTALSAIPGIGQTRNMGKFGKMVEKSNKAADDAAKAVDDIAKKVNARPTEDEYNEIFGAATFRKPESRISPTQDMRYASASPELSRGSKELSDLIEKEMRPLNEARAKADELDALRIQDLRFRADPMAAIQRYFDDMKTGAKDAVSKMKGGSKEERDAVRKRIEEAKEARDKAKAESGKGSPDHKAGQQLVNEQQAALKKLKIHPISGTKDLFAAINPLNNGLADRQAFRETIGKQVEDAVKADPANLRERIASIPGKAGSGAKTVGANIATAFPMMAAHEMGQGSSPQDSLTNALMELSQHPEQLVFAMAPIGVKSKAGRMTGVTGRYGDKLPFAATRAGALGDQMGQMSEEDVEQGWNEDEILRRLDALRLGG